MSGIFRELFAATSAASGALTGLLFVAMSVAPRRAPAHEAGPPVIVHVRAAAALLMFTSTLAVSLFSLVPGTNPGYPALVVGVVGMAFTAAAVRSIWTSQATRRQRGHQVELMGLLLLVFGTEIGAGIAALASSGRGIPVQMIGYAVVSSLLIGIARAWELIGDRNTGIVTSIAILTGRWRGAEPGEDAAAEPLPAQTGDPGRDECPD